MLLTWNVLSLTAACLYQGRGREHELGTLCNLDSWAGLWSKARRQPSANFREDAMLHRQAIPVRGKVPSQDDNGLARLCQQAQLRLRKQRGPAPW